MNYIDLCSKIGTNENEENVVKSKDSSILSGEIIRNLGLWSNSGNYTINWGGLTGNWASDQSHYNSTTDYYINSPEDFAAFIRILNSNINYTFKDKNIILTSDIDLSAHYWDMAGGAKNGPINSFSGTFEGENFIISNMIIDYTAYNPTYIPYGSDFGGFGLFPYLYKATVRNFSIKDSEIIIGSFAPSFPVGFGFVAGMASGSSISNINISNCNIAQTINNGQGSISIYFGGVIGASYNPFTRSNPQNLPNTYSNCYVDKVNIFYTNTIDGNWKYILAFGGIVGGDYNFGAIKTNEFNSKIQNCYVNNFTVTRGVNLDTAFMYECYGGIIGFSNFPLTISESYVSNLLIDLSNTATKNGATFGSYGPATAIVGGITGYGSIDPRFTQGEYGIFRCSATGVITAEANPELFPVYIGGLFGMNDDPAIDTAYNYTKFDFTALFSNKNSKLIYSNLFGELSSPKLITQNIFNNWDYIALIPEDDGYSGRKLSTFTIAGFLTNSLDTDFSANWGIKKNVLLVNINEVPLNYIQCEEATFAADFYDYWNILSYIADNASQISDKSKITFTKDSGDSYWKMSSTIQSIVKNPTWNYIKNIRVLPNGYIILATADSGGIITPDGTITVGSGESHSFSIFTDIGYEILDVLVDGVSVGPVSEYAFTNVSADHTIHATFTPKGINYTIISSSDEGGTIIPLGAVVVKSGEDKYYKILPDDGYDILDVLVDSTSIGPVSEYTFFDVSHDHTIHVTFTPKAVNYIIISSADKGGVIIPVGTVIVESGEDKYYKILPDEDYVILDVLVDGISIGAVSEFTFFDINANHTIHATFITNCNYHKILSSTDKGGIILPLGTIFVETGTSQYYRMIPDPGYVVLDVLVDGVSIGPVSEYTFTNINDDHTIHVTFENKCPYHKIISTADNGGILLPLGTIFVETGENQYYRMIPNKGYTLLDVLVDGINIGPVYEYTFTNINSDHAIHVTFIANNPPQNNYKIISSSTCGGTISPHGITLVKSGEDNHFNISPMKGYSVLEVFIDGVSIGPISSYTFKNVVHNHKIHVVFYKKKSHEEHYHSSFCKYPDVLEYKY